MRGFLLLVAIQLSFAYVATCKPKLPELTPAQIAAAIEADRVNNELFLRTLKEIQELR